ncbi:MAG: FtsX-like permease family protein [Bacteroidota bacterium]
MNLPLFISKRIRKPQTSSFSATVTKLGIASIAVGIAVMIIAFMVLFGFKANIVNKLFTLAPQIKISKFTLNQSYDEPAISTNTQLFKNWKNIPEITHLQAVAHKTGILKAKDDIGGVLLKGVDKNFNWANFSQSIIKGKSIQYLDSGYSNEIIISQLTASQLNLKVNDSAIIYFLQQPPKARKLKIVGIYETNLEEFDKQLILGDLALVQRLNNWPKDSVGAYEISLNNFENLPKAQESIAELMDPNMNIENAQQRFLPIFDWLVLLDRNMILFLVILFFVACFNIIAVLLVLLMERIPMVGVLKAIGSSDWSIRKIFVYVGINMILKGLFWGNLSGILICFIQWKFHLIPLDPTNYFISYVPIEWHFEVILLINLITTLLVSLVIIIPTFIITKLKLIEAISFRK